MLEPMILFAFIVGLVNSTVSGPVIRHRLLAEIQEWASDRSMRALLNLNRDMFFQVHSGETGILMVGDSLTAMAQWDNFFPNADIDNSGVNGNTTSDVLARSDAIISRRPRKVLLMIGINDLSQGHSPEVVFNNYVRLVQVLRTAGIEIVLQSTLECSYPCEMTDQVRDLNSSLLHFSRVLGLEWIDLNAVLSDEGGLRADLTTDGVHLNETGYRIWAETIRPIIVGP